VGGAPSLVASSGVVTQTDIVDGVSRSVLYSPAGNSLSLQNPTVLLHPDQYTVAALFRFAEIDHWRRILNSNGADPGLYTWWGQLVEYPDAYGISGAIVAPNSYVQVVFTRGTNGQVAGYVNGVLQFTARDASGAARLTQPSLLFFKDDTGEDADTTVARIRIWDGPLSGAAVAALDRLPQSPSATPIGAASATTTPAPTATITSIPTQSPSVTASMTPSPTTTSTPSSTLTPTATNTSGPTMTISPTPTSVSAGAIPILTASEAVISICGPLPFKVEGDPSTYPLGILGGNGTSESPYTVTSTYLGDPFDLQSTQLWKVSLHPPCAQGPFNSWKGTLNPSGPITSLPAEVPTAAGNALAALDSICTSLGEAVPNTWANYPSLPASAHACSLWIPVSIYDSVNMYDAKIVAYACFDIFKGTTGSYAWVGTLQSNSVCQALTGYAYASG